MAGHGDMLNGEHTAVLAKGEDGLDFVIAVVAAGADVQREVDLGVGGFAHQLDPPPLGEVARSADGGGCPGAAPAPSTIFGGPPPPRGEELSHHMFG